LHQKDLPGCPDLAFARYHVAIFIHGCFWHGHECHLFKQPLTRTQYWIPKIAATQKRDQQGIKELQAMGFRTLIIWECALRGAKRHNLSHILQLCEQFITHSNLVSMEIKAD
jgi:DNA mismatch endonuclease (patch repair protein)